MERLRLQWRRTAWLTMTWKIEEWYRRGELKIGVVVRKRLLCSKFEEDMSGGKTPNTFNNSKGINPDPSHHQPPPLPPPPNNPNQKPQQSKTRDCLCRSHPRPSDCPSTPPRWCDSPWILSNNHHHAAGEKERASISYHRRRSALLASGFGLEKRERLLGFREWESFELAAGVGMKKRSRVEERETIDEG
ncbi:hypothetical protein LWI28_020763 [Acer negundo]|uniref:Uncharacterized protein n=1 Tax=Acer negundo TaxID=4023 RepID=A0AAD5JBE2_ACENE|nr:hypothetical protein LWI28_020763 [Acer negundo]